MIMSCPVCEGQGNIYSAKVIELGMMIKICDECEACWKDDQPVTIEYFKALRIFLKEHGLVYRDSTIIDLGYIQENV